MFICKLFREADAADECEYRATLKDFDNNSHKFAASRAVAEFGNMKLIRQLKHRMSFFSAMWNCIFLHACEIGNFEVMKGTRKYGAKVNDEIGLKLALINSNTRIIDYLIKKNVHDKDFRFGHIVYKAVKRGCKCGDTILQFLQAFSKKYDYTSPNISIADAFRIGNIKLIDYLYKRSCGFTDDHIVLALAVISGSDELIQYVLSRIRSIPQEKRDQFFTDNIHYFHSESKDLTKLAHLFDLVDEMVHLDWFNIITTYASSGDKDALVFIVEKCRGIYEIPWEQLLMDSFISPETKQFIRERFIGNAA